MKMNKIFSIFTFFILLITTCCIYCINTVEAVTLQNDTFYFSCNRGPRLKYTINNPEKFIVSLVDNNGISSLTIEKYKDSIYEDISSKVKISNDKSSFEIPSTYIGENGLKIKVKAVDKSNNYSSNILTIYKLKNPTDNKYYTANLAPRISLISIPSIEEERMTEFIFKATDNDKIQSVTLIDLNSNKNINIQTIQYKGKAYLSCKLDSLKAVDSVYRIKIDVKDSTNSTTSEQICFTTKKGTKSIPIFVAHRGASKLAKENTVNAFKKAANSNTNVRGIETDIRVSKDNELVCVHNEKVNNVEVKDINYSYLKNFDVATFDEYLDIVKKSGKLAIIELKNETSSSTEKVDVAGGTNTIKRIIKKLKSENMIAKSIIIAFDYESLEYIRNNLKSDIWLGYLVSNPTKEHINKAAKLGKICIGLNQKNASHEIIEYAHQKGVRVNVYTADDYERQSILNDMGADIITTNVVDVK